MRKTALVLAALLAVAGICVILWNGNRPQIKRRIFEGYIDKLNVI